METAREHGHCRMPAGERSGLPAAEDGGAGDAVDAEGEGAHAEVAVVGAAHLLGVPEGAGHVRLELPVHLLLVPHEPLDVLHPLEVAHRHAARVGQDVRQDQHPLLRQNLVGLGVCRVVRSLDDVLCFDGISIVLVYDSSQSCRDEHIALFREQRGRVDGVAFCRSP